MGRGTTRPSFVVVLFLLSACASGPAAPPRVVAGRAQLALVRMTCRAEGKPDELACPDAVAETAKNASRRIRTALRERPVDCPDAAGDHVLHMLWDADQGSVVSTDFEFSPTGGELPSCLRERFVAFVSDALTELWLPNVARWGKLVITWDVELRVP